MLPRERITRALGHFTDARVPSVILDRVLNLYTRAYHVDLSEAVSPPGGYGTFNEFFTRKLRDGVRPIDPGADVIVSPADGRLDDVGPIDDAQTFSVKGQTYDAAGLLGSSSDAARFAGGEYAVVYLSPRDYHRVHAPLDGTITHVRHLPGTLYPVNAFGVRHVPRLFARNERVVIQMEHPTLGALALVMVGAMIVGRITLTLDAPPRPAFGGPVAERRYQGATAPKVSKGDELGAFQLGSTVVLLMERPGRDAWRLEPDLLGTPVRFGQALFRRSPA